jgi:hypothetical protein
MLAVPMTCESSMCGATVAPRVSQRHRGRGGDLAAERRARRRPAAAEARLRAARNVKGWLAADWLYGARTGVFGQFDGNDRVVTGIEWGL